MNQPRLRATHLSDDAVEFGFIDVTNLEPGTVLQGTHQLTPSEQAQLDKLKAKELLKKQVVDMLYLK